MVGVTRWNQGTAGASGQEPATQHSSLHTDDKLEQQHSLFTRYKDPCRLGPGEEKPWAIGKQGAGLPKRRPQNLISDEEDMP